MAAAVQPRSRIPGIEGLRACAAAAVLTLHLWWVPVTAGGRTYDGTLISALIAPLNEGVPLFFVLSGFLLWRPIAAAVIHARPLPSVRRYARNRALRILPAYWAVLLVAALVLESARITPAGMHAVDGAVHAPGLLLQDALLVQNLRPSTLSSGLSPAWSLAVEVVFYALLPVLAVCSVVLARRGTRRARLAAALAPSAILVAVGIAGKLVATFVVPGPEAVFAASWHSVLDSSFLTHADLFAFGMIVAVLRVEHEAGHLSLRQRALVVIDPLLCFAPFILVFGFWFVPRYLFDPLIACLCSILLARVVLAPPEDGHSWIVRVLESRPFVALGVISYSVFLWNYPVAVFLTRLGLLTRPDSAAAVATNLAIGVPIVVVLGTATYLLIERPAMRLRRLPTPALRAARSVRVATARSSR